MLFFEAIYRGDLRFGMVLVNQLTHICEGCPIHRNENLGTLCRHHKVSP